MADPSKGPKTYKPNHSREDEESKRREDRPLNQLSEAGYKKARQGGDDVAGRSLSHAGYLTPQPRQVNSRFPVNIATARRMFRI
jgi:hypothetical protein